MERKLMKKKCLITILLAIFMSYLSFSNENKIIFSLDTQISEVIELLGEPNEIKIEEFPKHDYDSICYFYDSLNLYRYRISKGLYLIRLKSNKYHIQIDNKIITCGLSKTEIDKLFNNGTIDGHDSQGNTFYYYGLTNLRELRILYDKNHKAIRIDYGYSNP